jgi:flagellar basal-body rod modification protein FlgD
MTTPVNGPTGTVSDILKPPTAVGPAPTNAMGKDTFLKLLVAQLKYQNPLSPTDGTEFMAQTAQFTVVEKLDELAKQNAELLGANRSLGASAMIGKQVVSTGLDGTDVVGTVTGVRLDAGGPILLTGDTEVSLPAVKEVRAAGS